MCQIVTIRSKIAEIRREKNIKQADLAHALGIDPSQLRRLEGIGISTSEHTAKSIGVEILNKLCEILECQVGDLFTYEVEDNV